MQEKLNEYRAKIDYWDTQIISLINGTDPEKAKQIFIKEIRAERLLVVKQIAIIKKENGLPIIDTAREKQVKAKYGKENASIVKSILEESRAVQEEIFNAK